MRLPLISLLPCITSGLHSEIYIYHYTVLAMMMMPFVLIISKVSEFNMVGCRYLPSPYVPSSSLSFYTNPFSAAGDSHRSTPKTAVFLRLVLSYTLSFNDLPKRIALLTLGLTALHGRPHICSVLPRITQLLPSSTLTSSAAPNSRYQMETFYIVCF